MIGLILVHIFDVYLIQRILISLFLLTRLKRNLLYASVFESLLLNSVNIKHRHKNQNIMMIVLFWFIIATLLDLANCQLSYVPSRLFCSCTATSTQISFSSLIPSSRVRTSQILQTVVPILYPSRTSIITSIIMLLLFQEFLYRVPPLN